MASQARPECGAGGRSLCPNMNRRPLSRPRPTLSNVTPAVRRLNVAYLSSNCNRRQRLQIERGERGAFAADLGHKLLQIESAPGAGKRPRRPQGERRGQLSMYLRYASSAAARAEITSARQA